jgi:hypothetical protein
MIYYSGLVMYVLHRVRLSHSVSRKLRWINRNKKDVRFGKKNSEICYFRYLMEWSKSKAVFSPILSPVSKIRQPQKRNVPTLTNLAAVDGSVPTHQE